MTFAVIRRIEDFADPDAEFLAVLTPRDFSAGEAPGLIDDIVVLEQAITSLANLVIAHRPTASSVVNVGTYPGTITVGRRPANPGQYFGVTPIRLTGVAVQRCTVDSGGLTGASGTYATDDVQLYIGAGTPVGPVTNMANEAALAVAFALPEQLFNVCGPLLEGAADMVRKSKLPAELLLPEHAVAWNRLLARQTRGLVEHATMSPVFTRSGRATGSVLLAGRRLARALAPHALAAVCPVLYAWLAENTHFGDIVEV